MAMVDLATPFTQRWKEYELNNSGVSLWENYLKGVQQTYQPQITAYQQQAAYDISGAFANYKQQQRNILQNQRLETSLQQQLSGQLEGAYQSAYSSATAQAASNLSKVAQAYAKDVAAGEKQFAELGEMSAKAFEALYAYASEVDETQYDVDEVLLGEGGRYGFYTIDPTTGARNPTQKGLDFYDRILNKQTTRFNKETGQFESRNFRDWLRANEGYADVADFYEANYEQFADILGGSEVSDLTYSDDEQYRVAADEAMKRYKELGGKESKNFDTYQEASEYYSEQSQILAANKIDLNKYTNDKISKQGATNFENTLKSDVGKILNLSNDKIKTYQISGIGPSTQWSYQVEINKNDLSEKQLNLLKNSGAFVDGNNVKINLSTGDRYTSYNKFFKAFRNREKQGE